MKSDEIYDGVNAIDAVRDVLNACRSEESVKDASYSYVVTKTNTARELLGDFLDVILKEEYKDAYKKDKTANKKVIMDVIATCQDVICDNVVDIYDKLADWVNTYMLHTWQEITENKTA